MLAMSVASEKCLTMSVGENSAAGARWSFSQFSAIFSAVTDININTNTNTR